jgi:hypothetical protein
MKLKIPALLIGIFLTGVMSVMNIYGVELTPKLEFEDDELYKPYKIRAHDKYIYILDAADQAIKVYDRGKKFVKAFGSKGRGPGEMVYATDFVVYDEKLYVLDAGGRKVQIFSVNDDKFKKQYNLLVPGALKIALADNKIFVASTTVLEGQKLINYFQVGTGIKITHKGAFLDSNPISRDYRQIYKNMGILNAGNGKIYFAFVLSNKVYEFTQDGNKNNVYTLPFRPIEKPELVEKNNRLSIKKMLNYDLKQEKNELYILSRNEKNISIISRLSEGEWQKTYTMKEQLIMFEIWDDELWTISNELELFIYDIKKGEAVVTP